VEGDTARYSTEENVTLHTDYEGEINTYEITLPGDLDLYPQDFNDQVTLEQDEQDPDQVLITFTNSEGDQVVYKVKGPPSKISIHALPQNVKAKVWTSRDQGIYTWFRFDQLEISPIEEWFGNIEVPDSDAGDGTGTPPETPPFLEALMNQTGKTQEQVEEAILEFYPEIDGNGDGGLSREEIEAAQNAHVFPPRFPNGRFFQFLYRLDSEFAGYLDQFASGDVRTRNGVMAYLRTRLVELLNTFYDSVQASGSSNANSDNLYFEGEEYDFIHREANGRHRGGYITPIPS
jgi:hypothetical protein